MATPFELYPYIREVNLRCQHAAFALAELRAALTNRSQHTQAKGQLENQIATSSESATEILKEIDELKHAVDEDYNQIFFFIESFLYQIGHLSSLIWISAVDAKKPKNADRAQRCTDIQAELSISGSFTIESPDFRNDIAHIDDRLDAWAAAGHQVFVDMNVVPGPLGIRGVNASAAFREIDESTLEYSFGGKRLDILAAEREVNVIGASALLWLESHDFRL